MPDNRQMKIGQVIRKIRKDRDATLEAVALAAGTDPGNLSKVERGIQQPTPEMLSNVARVLGVSVSMIYTIAELTSSQQAIIGTSEQIKQAMHRLEGFVSQFMLLTPTNQQIMNDFVSILLKSQSESK